MIEQFLSIQDTIAIGLLVGMVIKTIQFLYFDKRNHQKQLNWRKK